MNIICQPTTWDFTKESYIFYPKNYVCPFGLEQWQWYGLLFGSIFIIMILTMLIYKIYKDKETQ